LVTLFLLLLLLLLLMLLWYLAAYMVGVTWFIFIPAVLAVGVVLLLIVRIVCEWLVARVVGPAPQRSRMDRVPDHGYR
jgi:membrane protein implicated in regulation of membrane protease activity